MHNLSFSLVDLLVVLTVAVSAGLAIWRGFVRETLSVFAWAAAAFATLYFGPSVAAFLHERISSHLLGTVIGFGGTFLVVLIPLSFVSYRFSEGVQNSPIGAIDRSLGFAFGVIRGLFVVGLAYLAFSMMVPVRTQPEWLTGARLLPLVQGSSDVILSLIPTRDAAAVAGDSGTPAPYAPIPKPAPRQAAAAAHHGKKAYGAQDRRALDRLIEATGNGGNNKP
jgi:membrane protein required for colicin V production